MIYIEHPITINDFENYNKLVVIFKFYNKKGILKEIALYKYFELKGKYYLTIKEIAENTLIKNILVTDVENTLSEINYWITNGYYCNKNGSVVIYVAGEKNGKSNYY